MSYPKTSEYQIRLIELHGLRNLYMPEIYKHAGEWSKNHFPWLEDIESAFEWMVEESVQKLFNCKVTNHFPSDYGEFLYDLFPNFKADVLNTLEFMKIQSNDPIRQGEIVHIKVSVLGNLGIFAVLYK